MGKRAGNTFGFELGALGRLTAATFLAVLTLLLGLQFMSTQRSGPAMAQVGGSWTDSTVLDLSGCSVLTDTRVTNVSGGEVRLAAIVEDYFDGPNINTTIWITESYSGLGIEPIQSGGILTVNTSAIRSIYSDFTTTMEVEGRLRFAPPPDYLTGEADFGFSNPDQVNLPPMALFITDSDDNLYANDWAGGTLALFLQRTLITLIDLTQYHDFRISVSPDQVDYYIDGTLVVTHPQTTTLMSSPVRLWVLSTGTNRNFNADWVRWNQYPSSGTFVSCPIDAGQPAATWSNLSWSGEVITDTGVSVQTRTSEDGITWTGWSASNSASTFAINSPVGRYLQYRLNLTTTNSLRSPQVNDVTVTMDTPVSDAGGPYSGDEDTVIALSGSGSFDPGGGALTYGWDLDDDGQYDDAFTVNTSYSWPEPGTYQVSLMVTDTVGLTSTDTAQVAVGNLAPMAVTDGPYSGAEGASIALDGSGSSDPGGGALTYAWDLDDDGQYDDAFTATPSYAWPEPGTFSLTLQVTDNGGLTNTAVTTVTLSNLAPTAQAGGPYVGNEGASITLDGSASSDPGGGPLAYAWDLDDDGQYDDAFTTTLSYSWAEPDTYTVSLIITDTVGLTSADIATVTVSNLAPLAEAGGPYGGAEGALILLDGLRSSDPGGGALTYAWDLDDDGQYDDAFTAIAGTSWAEPGTYQVSLVVTDTFGLTNTDAATVTVSNLAPTAEAGGPYSGDEGASITLDGSGSLDPIGGSLSYAWDLDYDGFYDDAFTAITSYSWPEPGTYTVRLIVTDTVGLTNIDIATVTVNNLAPIAEAGGPYTGDRGASIILDGSASSDPGGGDLTYAWDLDDDGQYDDAFTANTSYSWAVFGIYQIGLMVTDTVGLTDTNIATVTVIDQAPTAQAGGPYSGDEGASITLDGSASSDPGGGALTYAWDLDDDSQYDDAFTTSTNYSWAEPGTYRVSLTVTDTVGLTDTNVATVTVSNLAPTAVISGPLTAAGGETLTFDGSQSSDLGGGPPLSYAWEFDGDDDFDDATSESVNRSFSHAGVYTIGLRVADAQGAQGAVNHIINITTDPWNTFVFLPVVLK